MAAYLHNAWQLPSATIRAGIECVLDHTTTWQPLGVDLRRRTDTTVGDHVASIVWSRDADADQLPAPYLNASNRQLTAATSPAASSDAATDEGHSQDHRGNPMEFFRRVMGQLTK